jgi:hypothetical protein
MSGGRSTGFILMALAVAAFLGSTSEVLPPATFFPALALFGIGAVKFLKSSREALAEAEQRIQEKLHPVIRENRAVQAGAERRAQRRGATLNQLNAPAAPAAAAAFTQAGRRQAGPEALELELPEEDLVVNPDVSFPVEVQRGDALADQLRKLNQLLTQGILTEQEYAIAKAKLLS